MKFLFALLFLALAAVALGEKSEVESIEPAKAEKPVEAPRDKRGVFYGAAYTAPVAAYAAYTSPVAYSSYSYPYAYSAYSAYRYPYYYSSPYIVG